MQLHRLAKLYGKLPSELIGLSIVDWSINVIVAVEGTKADAKDAQRG